MAPKSAKKRQRSEGTHDAAKRNTRITQKDQGDGNAPNTDANEDPQASDEHAGGEPSEIGGSDHGDGGLGEEEELDEQDQRALTFIDKRIDKKYDSMLAQLRREMSLERPRANGMGQSKSAKAKPKARAKAQAISAVPAAPGINPALAAVATASYSNAQEGHRQVYRSLSLMANEAYSAMASGDQASLEHHLKALQALGRISVGAVENIGPQPHYGLNAMLKYISSSIFNCVMTPDATNYNQATAQAMLEAAKAEHGGGGRGGRGGRGGGASPPQDADKDRERRDYRRDDRRDDRDYRRDRR